MAGSNSSNELDDKALVAEDWSSPPEQRYAERQVRLAAHYDLDVESRTTYTDAVGRIHYLVAGNPDGEPVLLLHSLSSAGAVWIPLASALTDKYRLYAPDRPGRGLTETSSYQGRDVRQFLCGYLLEILASLDIERPHVIGNSLGGGQAFLLAIDHDMVDRLCLVGAPVGVSRDFSIPWRLLTVRGINRLLFRLMSRGDSFENAQAAVRERFVHDDSAIPGPLYALLAAQQDLPGRQQSLRSMFTEGGSFGRMDPLFDIRDEIAGIERPTCFVWGSQDSFWPPDTGRSLAARMTEAEFHELPGHGHMPWLEPGDAARTHIKSFLDR